MNASTLKVLRNANLVAIGIPIVLCLLAIFENGIIVFAALSTMITGFIQVLIALVYWFFNRKDVWIILYFVGLFVFGLLVFSIIDESTLLSPAIPLVLCLYLSYIIHFKKHHA